MGSYAVAITGASGSAYGMRLVEQLIVHGHQVALTMTEAGRDVAAYEIGFELPAEEPARTVLRFLELPQDASLRYACEADLFDPMASGSHVTDAMIVCPASMGFCGALAGGLGASLPQRAADVQLKEGRKLVVVPRETPLSLIHLRNLTTLAEAGAQIVPAMPAFYQRPETLDDAVNFVVGKVLDVIGVEHDLFERWGE